MSISVGTESLLGYHPWCTGLLTSGRKPAGGQWQTGSLTGAVASERVSEALKGLLRMDGNHPESAKAEAGLTATATVGAGTKVGLSDPVAESGIAIAQRIKATLGITGLSGWAVRPLKWYASWVQNVVRQFGPYPAWAQEICRELALVREDRAGRAAGAPAGLPSA